MKITHGDVDASQPGGADNFTGTVWIDRLAVGEGASKLRVDNVTFMPGARTRWHTHPLGQVLYVVSGVGRIAVEGQPVRELVAGDRIWVDADRRHWHGAAPDRVFVHIAIQEAADDGEEAQWFEPVSDEDYEAMQPTSSGRSGRSE